MKRQHWYFLLIVSGVFAGIVYSATRLAFDRHVSVADRMELHNPQLQDYFKYVLWKLGLKQRAPEAHVEFLVRNTVQVDNGWGPSPEAEYPLFGE
jgi:hypothetical protein